MTNIRPISPCDLESVQQMASDPAIAATANLPSPYPHNGATEWYIEISKGISEGKQVVFTVTSGSECVGVMTLNAIDLDNGQCALDYWIGKPHWGQGHATKAAALAIDYARYVLGLHRINSCCLKANPGSRRVLEKSGFTFTAESDYHGPCKDRFGHMKIPHCVLDFNQSGAQQGEAPEPASTDR